MRELTASRAVAVASVALLTACGAGSLPPTSAGPAPTSAAPALTLAPPRTGAGPGATVAAPTTSSTTSPATTVTTSQEETVEVLGSEEFIAHTGAALSLLEADAAEPYQQVVTYVDTIQAVEAGSGMDVFTKTFLAGQETAYAPGYPESQQVVWYAGTIVHDSCHSRLYAEGVSHLGKEAELACLADQLDALHLIQGGDAFVGYVQSLIDGADDPANQYWNDPNRHW